MLRSKPEKNRDASEVLKAVKALNKLIKKEVVVPSAELSEILLHLQELAEQSPVDFSSLAVGLLISLIEQLEALAKTSPQLAKKTKPILASLRSCRDSIAPVAA
jgi:hypothetical protein